MLRTALTAAYREELITRNVAGLVLAPRVAPRELKPWTVDEILAFLEAARSDPMYPAFVLAVVLGLRRGEVLGLHWRDVDLDSRTLTVRTTLHRGSKELYEDTTKNRRARVVPLPLMCVAPLRWQRLRQSAQRASAGKEWGESDYVFTTRSGCPVEPRNLYRCFGPRQRAQTCRASGCTTPGTAARPSSSRLESLRGP